MNYQDIYRPPFKTKYDGLYIIANNGVKAFTVASKGDFKADAENVVRLLNGSGGNGYSDVQFDATKIVADRSVILAVRGWGHMKSQLQLSPQEATEAQKQFIQWAAERIAVKDKA